MKKLLLSVGAAIAMSLSGNAVPQDHPQGSLEQEMLDFANTASASQLDSAIRMGWMETSFTDYLVQNEVQSVVVHRNGPDGLPGTADDNPFDTLRELYDTTTLGPESMEGIERYVTMNLPLPNGSATLRFANKHTTTSTLLKKKVGVNNLAASNIPKYRKAGPDHVLGNADDVWMGFKLIFGQTALYGYNGEAHVHSLDETPGCDAATIQKLSDYAALKGY